MTDPVSSAVGFAHLDHPEWRIPIFNPGHNTAQVSVIRIINNTNRDLSIRVHGQREDGQINPDRLGVCTDFSCDDHTYVQGWLRAATAVHITSAQSGIGRGHPAPGVQPRADRRLLRDTGRHRPLRREVVGVRHPCRLQWTRSGGCLGGHEPDANSDRTHYESPPPGSVTAD